MPSGWLHATFNLGDAVAGMAFQDNEAKGLVATAKQVHGVMDHVSLALCCCMGVSVFRKVLKCLGVDHNYIGHNYIGLCLVARVLGF